MLLVLLKTALILTLTFGSVGGVTAISADSLPNSALYPTKLAVEQVRLQLASSPSDKAELHLEFAQTRLKEMERMAWAGEAPDEAMMKRLQTHLQQGLHFAAQAPDEAMLRWMVKAQQMAQEQEQKLIQVRLQTGRAAHEPLQQALDALDQWQLELDGGLLDPQTFRWRHNLQRPEDAPELPDVAPEPSREGPGPGEPGGGQDCDGTLCLPTGDQNQYGQDQDTDPGQYGPGEPGGNPAACAGEDCEPVGDQHQYGPQPDQPGAGEPGYANDCDGTLCLPTGDQNQYGPGEQGGGQECDGTACLPVGDEHQYGQEDGSGGNGNGSQP